MMRREQVRIGLIFAVSLVAGPGLVVAQAARQAEVRTALAGSFSSWRFSTPLAQDSLSVSRVSQVALPVSTAFTVGRWSFDAGFAYASGRVRLADGRNLSLAGPTDVRVRAVGRLVGDNLLITLGATLPTGKTGLAGSQIEAIRVLGAPALKLPVSNLGIGAAGTVGLVYATRAGGWNVGFGASFEGRGSYAPIESQIAGVSEPTNLRPGNTYRASIGLDRLVGAGRVSIVVIGEGFSDDKITLPAPGGQTIETRYRLGPQLSGAGSAELAVRGFRTFTVTVADRYRSKFTDVSGNKAAGSSGNVFVVAVDGTSGVAGRTGVVFRVDGRLDGGLEVDNTITTAAMTSVGLTLGLSLPAGSIVVMPFVRGQAGSIDIGPIKTTATGFGAGLRLVFGGRGVAR